MSPKLRNVNAKISQKLKKHQKYRHPRSPQFKDFTGVKTEMTTEPEGKPEHESFLDVERRESRH